MLILPSYTPEADVQVLTVRVWPLPTVLYQRPTLADTVLGGLQPTLAQDGPKSCVAAPSVSVSLPPMARTSAPSHTSVVMLVAVARRMNGPWFVPVLPHEPTRMKRFAPGLSIVTVL